MNKKSWNTLAKEYHDFIISPFQKQVKNPLFKELNRVPNKNKKIVAEFGCGRFELGEFLSKSFQQVKAFDFSEKMIEIAKENEKFSNVEVKKLDTTQMKLQEKFDITISVNSIIMPSPSKIKIALSNIHKSLTKKGKFFLIIPSMESVLYEGMLILDNQLKNKTEKKAISSAKRIQENKKYDYFLGHYKDQKDIQKFFYKHEIIYLLEKTGFKNLEIKKVEYPWKKEISDYEQFPQERPLWDWFISCEK